MTDMNGFKYRLGDEMFRTNEELNAALAEHLGWSELPPMGKHEGVINFLHPDGTFVTRFTYERVDGVDVITPV